MNVRNAIGRRVAGGRRIGSIGAGREASCLVLGRRGCIGVAKAGEDEGIGCGASLNGVFAIGLCGSAAMLGGLSQLENRFACRLQSMMCFRKRRGHA